MKIRAFIVTAIMFCITSIAHADMRDITKSYHVGDAIRATVTAYTDNPRENLGPGKPVGTAIGTRIRPGIVAVSRDLLKAGWEFGKKVYIEDLGVFIIEDTMSPRFRKRIDIAVRDMDHAQRIGKRSGQLAVLLHPKDFKTPAALYDVAAKDSDDES